MAIYNAVNLPKGVQDKIDESADNRSCLTKGIGGGPTSEIIPTFIARAADSVLPKVPNKQMVNAQIVFTKDRNASLFSGYGASETQCSAIDIVVGRMGNSPRYGKVHPNFHTDSARIYISQRSDIDKYFNLIKGSIGKAENKSAIALKADGIRIVAREGIKLVTGLDDKNSQDGDNKSIVGIDLIAGNVELDKWGEPLLQPLVRGENLRLALERIVTQIDKLAGVVDSFLQTQVDFNSSVTHHYHYSPWFGNQCTPSDTCISSGIKSTMNNLQQDKASLVTLKSNLKGLKWTYLNKDGKKYINSRWNNTN